MISGPTRLAALVILLAGSLAIAAFVVVFEAGGLVQPRVAIAFGAVILVGEVIRIWLPNGREAAPLGTAAALGYALTESVSGTPATHGAWQVVAVAAGATALGVLPHIVTGRAPDADGLARRLVVIATVAFWFRSDSVQDLLATSGPLAKALIMATVVAIGGGLDALLSAAVRAERAHAPFARAVVEELRATGALGVAIGITGVLMALAAPVTGLWAVPVFGAPLLLAQFSFRRFATIRMTYLQTIRSLSRVTELGGYTETGHLHRVADLAVAVGTEMGLSDAQLRDLEYAALLHDIGQLSLDEPIDGGATSWKSADVQAAIARDGAEVIRQTKVLDRVADIVERQSDPYRRPHEADDPHLSIASRIVRVVNAYDDAVGDSNEQSRQAEALEALRLGMAFDYDPAVVRTLGRVLDRRRSGSH